MKKILLILLALPLFTCAQTEFISGCTWDYSFVTNYNSLATVHQISETDASDPCQYNFGRRSIADLVCLDPLATNYDPGTDPSVTPSAQVLYDMGLLVDDESVCEYADVVDGCTDANAFNYNSEATSDDGSCEDLVLGCLDVLYTDFNSEANVDTEPSSCFTLIDYGCIDVNYVEYNAEANSDDGSCATQIVYGCTNSTFEEFNPLANTNDGSCLTWYTIGCTDVFSLNYNPYAINDDGSCIPLVFGCTDASAINFNVAANTYDGSCTYTDTICIDPLAVNVHPLVNYPEALNTYILEGSIVVDNVTCIYEVYGCTDQNAINYNPSATSDDGSCILDAIYGCMNTDYLEYNVDAIIDTDPSSCTNIIVTGCTDPSSSNYNPLVNVSDNNTCEYSTVIGCTDSDYIEYWTYDESTYLLSVPTNIANQDDGSCLTVIEFGCVDSNAYNYDANANVNQTSTQNQTSTCIATVNGCTDENADNYNASSTEDDGSCTYPVLGCMDSTADNYNSAATEDDSSCGYDSSGCPDLDFTFTNTGSNMIVFFTPPTAVVLASELGEGTIGAFFLNDSGVYFCTGSVGFTGAPHALAVMGDDPTTNEQDGFNANQEMLWFYETTSGSFYSLVLTSGDPFNTNGVINITDYVATIVDCGSGDVSGCTQENACNYDSTATDEDGNCEFSASYYNCSGVCLNDEDNDSVCDENEIPGCTDDTAINYNESATDEDGTCSYETTECVLPNSYVLNTGANMTLMLTPTFISSLNVQNIDAYIVALTDDGLVIGSALVHANELENGQVAMPLWADDATTSSVVDGAIDGENVTLQLVDGSSLYTMTLAVPISYSANAISVLLQPATPSFSCVGDIASISGCTDLTACNYNVIATADDGSCVFEEIGYDCTGVCIDDVDNDGICDGFEIPGCTDATALNYNELATDDNDSCEYPLPVEGCTDPEANNYNELANIEDDSCLYGQVGFDCILPMPFTGNTGSLMNVMLTPAFVSSLTITEPNAFVVALNSTGLVVGSSSVYGLTQTSLSIWGDDTLTPEVEGAVANEAISIQMINGTDLYNVGLSLPIAYSANALSVLTGAGILTVVDCGSTAIMGCTDGNADNYNASSTEDDGSCTYPVLGCMDSNADNYNSAATVDDSSCEYDSSGCPDLDFTFQNTGTNMTILFSSSFTDDQDIEEGTWIGVFSINEEYEMPICFGAIQWTGNQISIAAWGDDATTSEVDGFVTGDTLYVGYKLANGTVMCLDESPLYNTDAVIVVEEGEFIQVCNENGIEGCTDSNGYNYNSDATEDDGSCEYEQTGEGGCILPSPLTENTGINMTVLFTSSFISSLSISDSEAYLVALSNGIVVGSTNVGSTYLINGQSSLAIWGDNSTTEEEVGAFENASINFQLIDATNLYDIVLFSPVTYVTNWISIQSGTANLNLVECSVALITGCTDETADNYNTAATEDDGSCIETACPYDIFTEYSSTADIYDVALCQTVIVEGCLNSEYIEFNSEANTDTEPSSCVILIVEGCMDSTYMEFNPEVNTDTQPTSCETLIVEGCIDPLYMEFNSEANTATDPNSCSILIIEGCMDSLYIEFDSEANLDNGFCANLIVFGCTDDLYIEYASEANTNTEPTSCEILMVQGCTNDSAYNFDEFANTDDGSCYPIIMGCIDTTAFNFVLLTDEPQIDVNTDDASCIYSGCTELLADNYNLLASIDDGSCFIPGCTLSMFPNYNPQATEDDFSCDMNSIDVFGCTDIFADNYNSEANHDIGTCYKLGCIFDMFPNYNSQATVDDFSCDMNSLDVFGCTDVFADNYNLEVNHDNGTCYKFGCVFDWADNYNELATENDGSCTKLGCTFLWADNFDTLATEDDGSCTRQGCTSEWADNYDSIATIDNGSCSKVGCIFDWADNFEPYATIEATQIPVLFSGNTTDVNMTVMLTAELVATLNVTQENAYIVALTSDGQVVGSQSIYDVTQSSIHIWGDDTQTIEIDGALVNESISFQFVNGVDLYDIIIPSPITYTTNGFVFLTASVEVLILPSGNNCIRLGCNSVWADNYDALATEDDESCSMLGCTFDWADNYDVLATEDNDSCFKLGCTDDTAYNFDEFANTDDLSCYPFILGCIDTTAFNFVLLTDNPQIDVNTDDASCIYSGCTDLLADNYNALASIDDGSCSKFGCTENWADNYNVLATDNDGSCSKVGCTSDWADNFDSIATTSFSQIPEQFSGNTGVNMTLMLLPDFVNSLNIAEEHVYIIALTAEGLVVGSTNVYENTQTSMAIWGDDTQTPNADGAQVNESISFQLINGVDVYDIVMPSLVTYTTNSLSIQDSSGTLTLASVINCIKLGCTFNWADNYDDLATENDGSCSKLGCTEEWADNYDALATENDGSCSKVGCTEGWAPNFDPFATILSSQIPNQYTGNTGVAMTVLFTSPFISSLSISDSEAYLVALSNDLVVGSTNIGSTYLINGQQAITIWGDDTTTTEADGALANDFISFQLVNGIDLYNVEMPIPVYYTTNGMSFQGSAASLTLATGDDCIRLGCTYNWADNFDSFATEDDGTCSRIGCTSDWADNYDALATDNDGYCSRLGCTSDWADNNDVLATDDDGSCYKVGCIQDWADNFDPFATIPPTETLPEPFVGNTGSNMTVMLTPSFISSLTVTESNVYIVALNSEGLVIGSASLYGLYQEAIGIWGDDTSTPELDGAISNEAISFQLVNGLQLYDVTMPMVVNYSANSLAVQPTAAILTLVSGDLNSGCTRLGCTSDWADNYDPLATEDDESCSRLGCTSEWADNYDEQATENDNSCIKAGCTEGWADNFDVLANDNDGTCFKVGCTEDWADNFDPFSTISSTQIPEYFYGNTGVNMSVALTETFINSLIITEENAFIVALNSTGLVVGSSSVYGLTQTSLAVWGDDTLTPEVEGAVANEAISIQLINGTDLYNVDLSLPITFSANSLSVQTSSAIVTFISSFVDDCIRLGCTSEWADNFDLLATEDDESCSKFGCTSDWADNFDVLATEDDGSCSKLGCKDVSDCNFVAFATIDDGSCIGQAGCFDHFYLEYNPLAGCSLENACQTSWIQLYDSIQVEYNDLDISYNIESQELSNTILTLDSLQVVYNTITTLYIDSISQITQSYNSLDEECTQANIQSAFAIDSLNYVNGSYIDSINQITINYISLEEESAEDMLQSGLTIDSLNYLNGSLSEEVEYWSSSIVIDLIAGWNIIGYTSKEPQDVVATLQGIDDIILIVKNNAAEVYWPEFGFNGIGNLIPGQGYQIKVSEEYIGFTYPDVGGERIELTPTVPMWAIDMEAEMHPNDIRTLVRVVNMLGQEVNPATQFNGEVLLYLYNDGTVEKKIVE